MRILWLASWYPNQLFPLNGDFVQRHAQAVSNFNTIDVIHLCRDEKSGVTNNVKITFSQTNNLTETIIYYHSFTTGIKLIDRFFSSLKYRRLFKKAIRDYLTKNRKPDLVHVHVAMNAGLLALWVKKKFGIHYLVTEHWSGLLPEAENSFFSHSAFFKIAWKRIVENSLALSVVSNYLGNTINRKILKKNFTVIPNVVNTHIFKPIIKQPSQHIKFIHISRMDYQKNPEGIFAAFQLLSKQFTFFKLIIFSNEADKLNKLANQYNLTDYIEQHSETGQEQMVKYMQQADALVLFSRYETFGCVVAEANACGLPVIVSDIPTMHELAEENINGLFAANENAEDLAVKLLWFIKNRNEFTSGKIASAAAEKYNYGKVGKMFSDWYANVIKR